MAGTFISFEGTDGAGKTTVLNKVINKIRPVVNNDLLLTREPGGNSISEDIRNIILDPKNIEMYSKTEVLLYAASRSQHLKQTIIPALKNDKLVLCDRYVDSSIAYQGGGRNIGLQKVIDINQFATNGILPNITIYFDIPVQVGLNRIKKYRDETDRLDNEKLSFYKRVYKSYDKLIKDNPERFKIVDATQPIDNVVDDVLKILQKYAKQYF